MRAIRGLRVLVVLAGLAIPLCFAPSALAAGGGPTVRNASASSVTENGATLEAQIDPEGGETAYEFRIECQDAPVGSSACEELALSPQGRGQIAAGSGAETVSATLEDLRPGTSYWYVAVATNSAGRAESRLRSLVTQSLGACKGSGCPYTTELPEWVEKYDEEAAVKTVKEYEAKQQQKAKEHEEQQTKEAVRLAAEGAALKLREEEDEAAKDVGPVVLECVVPSLKGDTLSTAREALSKAHCVLGKVSRAKGRRGRLVVVGQRVGAGGKLPNDTRIGVALGPPPTKVSRSVLAGRDVRRSGRSPHAHVAVVGGAQVTIERAPWQVEIFAELEGGKEGLSCGGVILDSTHILTAGHCTYDPKTGSRLSAAAFVVVAGTASVTVEEIEKNPAVQAKLVSGVRVHPDFDYALGAGAPDDVAVLTLERPLMLDATVQPIGLVAAGASPVEGAPVDLTGFGEQSPGSEPNGSLYSLGLTVGFSKRCGGEADAVFVCASATGGSGCSGDSGSGLTSGSPVALTGVMDTVEVASGKPCPISGENGFVDVAAPEIRDFIEGSESPPPAPRGGGAIIYVTNPAVVGGGGRSHFEEGSVLGSGRAGGVVVGESLNCEPGTWSNDPTFTYTFIDSSSGQVLQQGASSTYAPSAADLGRRILCAVQAANAGGTALARTGALSAVLAAPVPEQPAAPAGGTTTPSTPPSNAALESGSVSLAGTSVTVQGDGIALVTLNCLGVASCRGKLTLTAKIAASKPKSKGRKQPARTATIGTVGFSIAGDETNTVQVKLDAAGRTLLSTDHGRLNASLALLELAPGPENTQTVPVRLAQHKAHGKAKK